MFAPFLERMAASVPYYKGLIVRGNPRWPHVTKWFEAMEERESFSGAGPYLLSSPCCFGTWKGVMA